MAAKKNTENKPEEAKAPEAKPEPKAEAKPEPEPEPTKTSEVVVAPGKAVGTRARGILKPGTPVIPEDFSTGQERIDQLLKAGYLSAK